MIAPTPLTQAMWQAGRVSYLQAPSTHYSVPAYRGAGGPLHSVDKR